MTYTAVHDGCGLGHRQALPMLISEPLPFVKEFIGAPVDGGQNLRFVGEYRAESPSRVVNSGRWDGGRPGGVFGRGRRVEESDNPGGIG
jgi:hypothetical protein